MSESGKRKIHIKVPVSSSQHRQPAGAAVFRVTVSQADEINISRLTWGQIKGGFMSDVM